VQVFCSLRSTSIKNINTKENIVQRENKEGDKTKQSREKEKQRKNKEENGFLGKAKMKNKNKLKMQAKWCDTSSKKKHNT
jgi:hypothetical protein